MTSNTMNFGPEWMRRVPKSTASNGGDGPATATTTTTSPPTKPGPASPWGASTVAGGTPSTRTSAPSGLSTTVRGASTRSATEVPASSQGYSGSAPGSASTAAEPTPYSRLISGTPQPPPQEDTVDHLNPFRYSRELMLSLYKPVNLPLEFERHEYITSDEPLEPMANVLLTEKEEELFSGASVNSELTKRIVGGGGPGNSSGGIGRGGDRQHPRGTGPSGPHVGHGDPLAKGRSYRGEGSSSGRYNDRYDGDSSRNYRGSGAGGTGIGRTGSYDSRATGFAQRSSHHLQGGPPRPNDHASWNIVDRNNVGSFGTDGVFRMTGLTDEDALEPAGGLDEPLEPLSSGHATLGDTNRAASDGHVADGSTSKLLRNAAGHPDAATDPTASSTAAARTHSTSSLLARLDRAAGGTSPAPSKSVGPGVSDDGHSGAEGLGDNLAFMNATRSHDPLSRLTGGPHNAAALARLGSTGSEPALGSGSRPNLGHVFGPGNFLGNTSDISSPGSLMSGLSGGNLDTHFHRGSPFAGHPGTSHGGTPLSGFGADLLGLSGSPLAKPAQWYYRDPQGAIQGPFSADDMQEWYAAGFFTPDLLVRRDAESNFEPLGLLISRLRDEETPFLTASQTAPPPARHGALPGYFPGVVPDAHTGGLSHPLLRNGSFGTTDATVPGVPRPSSGFGSHAAGYRPDNQWAGLGGGGSNLASPGLGAGLPGRGALPSVFPASTVSPSSLLERDTGAGSNLYGLNTERQQYVQFLHQRLQHQTAAGQPGVTPGGTAQLSPELSETKPDQNFPLMSRLHRPQPSASAGFDLSATRSLDPAIIARLGGPENERTLDADNSHPSHADPTLPRDVNEPSVAPERRASQPAAEAVISPGPTLVSPEVAEPTNTISALLKNLQMQQKAGTRTSPSLLPPTRSAPTPPIDTKTVASEPTPETPQSHPGPSPQATPTKQAAPAPTEPAKPEATATSTPVPPPAVAPWTTTPSRKGPSLLDIQMEEEKRAQRQQKAKAKAATPGSVKRYADAATRGVSNEPPAWSAVAALSKPVGGASSDATNVYGRPTVPTVGATTHTSLGSLVEQASRRSLSRSSSQTGTPTTPGPAPTTSRKVNNTPAAAGPKHKPSDDFIGWCRTALKTLKGISVDEFIQMLLTFPLDPPASTYEIIQDSVYAYSPTLDGRRFAHEFVKRRQADAGLLSASETEALRTSTAQNSDFVRVKGGAPRPPASSNAGGRTYSDDSKFSGLPSGSRRGKKKN
ncbi:kinesin-like protein [Tieghemiomyces parasiticus]|uniref:Kinesin-like protein n=1 Tax=Tieghemiomyces parasiticus TaxID=78921 RepID=A0A9W8ABD1_9FUNG|nr:kinesin-like protein [Tieghemiomyces parasiticus]